MKGLSRKNWLGLALTVLVCCRTTVAAAQTESAVPVPRVALVPATADSSATRLYSDAFSPALLRATLETLGQHRDLEYGLGVVPDSLGSCKFLSVRAKGSATDDIKHFLVGPGKGDADDAARRWNHAKVFPVRTENLNAGSGRNVKTAGSIDRHPVTIAAGFELCEVSPVLERTV